MKVGVIGAGTMGQGIAKAFAQVEASPLHCATSSRSGPGGKNKITFQAVPS